RAAPGGHLPREAVAGILRGARGPHRRPGGRDRAARILREKEVRAMTGRGFGRRDLFRAAGATVAIPAFLRDAFATAPEVGPRLVVMMQACGTHQQTFWPDAATGTSPVLDPILSQPALAA